MAPAVRGKGSPVPVSPQTLPLPYPERILACAVDEAQNVATAGDDKDKSMTEQCAKSGMHGRCMSPMLWERTPRLQLRLWPHPQLGRRRRSKLASQACDHVTGPSRMPRAIVVECAWEVWDPRASHIAQELPEDSK